MQCRKLHTCVHCTLYYKFQALSPYQCSGVVTKNKKGRKKERKKERKKGTRKQEMSLPSEPNNLLLVMLLVIDHGVMVMVLWCHGVGCDAGHDIMML